MEPLGYPIELREQFATRLKQGPPGVSQLHVPRAAHKEPVPKIGFEGHNLPAEMRLRHTETVRRPTETASPGDGDKIAKPLEVETLGILERWHGCTPCCL